MIFGGAGNAHITVGNGNQIIVGDNGSAGFSSPGVLGSVQSDNVLPVTDGPAPAPVKGNDTIVAGSGHNFILGGAGSNTITAGDGGDVVIGGDGTLLFSPVPQTVGASNWEAFGLGAVVGQGGAVTFTEGVLTSALSTDPTIFGNSHITTGLGHDLIIAGGGNATVNAGDGANIVVGGDGQVLFSAQGVLISISSVNPGTGGTDSLTAGAGNNVIVGGSGSDMIRAGNGNNVLLGDEGTLTYTANQLTSVQTTDPSAGGNDVITAGNGDDVVLGGDGADHVRLGNGRDVVVGHSGSVTFFADGAVASVATSDPQYGGNDAIVAGNGDNIVLGGAGAASISVGSGDNVVFGHDATLTYADTTLDGDNGTYAFSGRTAPDTGGFITYSDGLLISATSTDPTVGGADSITVGGGTNLVVGGVGANMIKGGGGNNIVIGNNGAVTYTEAAIISTIATIDPTANGGGDTVTLGDGNNIVLGGQGRDKLTVGNGRNIVLAADGEVTFTNGSYYQVEGHVWDEVTDGIVGDVQTLDPTLGGADQILAGSGDNLIFGGRGNDAIRVGNGDNVILAGNGEATFSFGLVFDSIQYTDAQYSGTDRILTGTGQNIVLQGNTDQTVPRLSLPVWQFEAAAPPAATAAAAVPINASQLNAVVLEAEQIWQQALGPDSATLDALSHVTVELGNLPGGALGATFGDVIVIDPTAAGWGWFTGTGTDDFSASGIAGVLEAAPGSAAAGHMDLLSTVLHELGNAMGLSEDQGQDVTGRVLEAGELRLPVTDAAGLVRQPDTMAPQTVVPAAHRAVAAKLLGHFPAGPGTPAASWITDFVNHAGQDETIRHPNAGLRIKIPAAGLSTPF